jgi:hypothetical protein
VLFSVHSTLTLTIADDGGVRQGVFWPPLSPTLMACAERALHGTRFIRSPAAWDRTVRIDLSPPAGD